MVDRRDVALGLVLTLGMASEAFAQAKRPVAPPVAPAPVVAAPVQKAPGVLRDEGMMFADNHYEQSKPPLAAEANVAVARPQRQGLGASLHIGGSTPHDDPDQLIQGVIQNLKDFNKKAVALQHDSDFMVDGKPVGDPFQNGVKQESKRIFALQVQDYLNQFKAQVPLETFLRESRHNDIAEKVAPSTKDANYDPDHMKLPNSANKMLADTIEQVDHLREGFETALGKWKVGQTNGGFFGAVTGAVTTSNRSQNAFDTAKLSLAANHLRGQLSQTEAAFDVMIKNANGAAVPQEVDPYADPYATPSKPQSELRTMPKPGAAEAKATLAVS